LVPGIPPWKTLTVPCLTAAILTSPAVQLFAELTSAKQLLACASAGTAKMVSAAIATMI
jgi:hypothetical protein